MFIENWQGLISSSGGAASCTFRSSGARINFCVTGYQHSAPPALGRNSPAKSSSVRSFGQRTIGENSHAGSVRTQALEQQ
jgi:hypothetical protein